MRLAQQAAQQIIYAQLQLISSTRHGIHSNSGADYNISSGSLNNSGLTVKDSLVKNSVTQKNHWKSEEVAPIEDVVTVDDVKVGASTTIIPPLPAHIAAQISSLISNLYITTSAFFIS